MDQGRQLADHRVRTALVQVVVPAQQTGAGPVAAQRERADRRGVVHPAGVRVHRRGVRMVGEDVTAAVAQEDDVARAERHRPVRLRPAPGAQREQPAGAVQHHVEAGAEHRGQAQGPGRAALGADGGRVRRPHRAQCLGQDVQRPSPLGAFGVLPRSVDRVQSTVRTTLPWTVPEPTSSCARPASASGKVRATCGRIRPSSTRAAIASSEA